MKTVLEFLMWHICVTITIVYTLYILYILYTISYYYIIYLLNVSPLLAPSDSSFSFSCFFLWCITHTGCVLIYKIYLQRQRGKSIGVYFKAEEWRLEQIFPPKEIVFIFLNENTHSSRGNCNLDKYLFARFLNYVMSYSLSHFTESYLCRIKVWYVSFLREKFCHEAIQKVSKIKRMLLLFRYYD